MNLSEGRPSPGLFSKVTLMKTGNRKLCCLMVLAGFTVWLQLACSSGGGGGSGGGPTSPGGGGSQGGGPTGPVSGNVQGSVQGFLNPGTPYGGTTVQSSTGASTQVTTSNSFGLDLPAGQHTLTFTGGRHATRVISVQVADGVTNRFDGIDLVETPEFNMPAFDDIYREREGTFRWVQKPKIFIHRDTLSNLPQGWEFFRREIIDKNLSSRMGELTNGVWANLDIRVGNFRDLPEDSPCLEVGNFEIHFRGIKDDCGRDSGSLTLGVASHCVFSVANEAASGVVTFNPCTGEGTVTHEIIHTLCSRHLDNAAGESIMTPFADSRVTDMTQMDMNHIRYMYSRPPGVRSPDNSAGLEVFTAAFLGSQNSLLGGFGGRRPRAQSEYLGSDGPAVLWEDHH